MDNWSCERLETCNEIGWLENYSRRLDAGYKQAQEEFNRVFDLSEAFSRADCILKQFYLDCREIIGSYASRTIRFGEIQTRASMKVIVDLYWARTLDSLKPLHLTEDQVVHILRLLAKRGIDPTLVDWMPFNEEEFVRLYDKVNFELIIEEVVPEALTIEDDLEECVERSCSYSEEIRMVSERLAFLNQRLDELESYKGYPVSLVFKKQ